MDFNTENKKYAAHSFEKYFFKLKGLWQNNGKFKRKNQCQDSKQ